MAKKTSGKKKTTNKKFEKLLESDKDALLKSLVLEIEKGMDAAIKRIEERDTTEKVPGAKEIIIARMEKMKEFFMKDDGKFLLNLIHEKIEMAIFPVKQTLGETFEIILNSRVMHEQDFLIQELVNGFISSKEDSIGEFKNAKVLDRVIKLFSESKNLTITSMDISELFHKSYHTTNIYVNKEFDKIANYIGLESRTVEIMDNFTGDPMIISIYSFSDEIIQVLEANQYIYKQHGKYRAGPTFGKIVFMSLILAKISMDRMNLKQYQIIGICAILALILFISLLPTLKVDNLKEKEKLNLDPELMDVIPHSWIRDDCIQELFPPLIKIIAFQIGGYNWLAETNTDLLKKLALQIQFLIQDINRWHYGYLVRVKIPIIVEISNIFQTVQIDSGEIGK